MAKRKMGAPCTGRQGSQRAPRLPAARRASAEERHAALQYGATVPRCNSRTAHALVLQVSFAGAGRLLVPRAECRDVRIRTSGVRVVRHRSEAAGKSWQEHHHAHHPCIR